MKIILNARVVEVNKKELPYSTICQMVGLEPFFNPTVAYHIKGKNEGGTLVDGMILELDPLMIINVAMTNNA